jgi:hypothetical protein
MRQGIEVCAFGALAALAGMATPAHAGQFVFTDTAFKNCCEQLVSGINDRGDVVGTNDPLSGFSQSFIANGTRAQVIGAAVTLDATGNLTNSGLTVGNDQVNSTAYAIDVYSGKLTPLPRVGSYLVGPSQITATGIVIGSAFNASVTISHGYKYAGGKASLFDPPGSMFTTPTVINARGEIAGTYEAGETSTRGFIYSAGMFTTFKVPGAVSLLTINAIDGKGRLAGSYLDATNRAHGFLVTDGIVSKLDYPGNVSTNPFGFGPGGEVVGTINEQNPYFTAHGFIYAKGKFTLIDDPKASPLFGTSVVAANASGVLAGSYFDGNGVGHAFTAAYQ